MGLIFRPTAWITRSSYALVSLLLVSGVAAEEQWRTYPQSGVQVFLGLDDTSAPTQVQDGRAQDLQNITLSISKNLRKRYGIKTIGGVTLDAPGDFALDAVTGLYYTKFSSGTERIIATVGTRFYYLNGTSWTQVFGAPVITAGQNNQFVFATALDNIIGTNFADPPLQYNGTTLTNVSFAGLTSTVQKAKTTVFFKNYLIFANTTEAGTNYPTRMRWSNVGTINTWSDEDHIDIGALGGQSINAVAELYDNLYLFLDDSIYKVSLVGGADTFQISKVTDDIGCIAKNSVQSITLTNAQNGLVFLDKDKKVYFFNGVIAQDITPFITETMGALGGSRLQYGVSADTNTSYVLCVTNSTGSSNDLCLEFQYQIGEWTKHTNLNANAMAHVLDANAADQVYFGTYTQLVHQLVDTSLKNDVAGGTGTVSSAARSTTDVRSSVQVLYDTSASYTADALIGAPLKLVGGPGSTATRTIIDNTTTGMMVASDFDTTPTSATTYEVGGIDAFYTTKWYDFGDSARLKHFGEVYFWADADVSSTHSVAYATDYASDISTLSLSLSASTSDALWGSAIWGTSRWGDLDTVFREGQLTGEGRYLKLKFSDDDPNENFNLYGWVVLYRSGNLD